MSNYLSLTLKTIFIISISGVIGDIKIPPGFKLGVATASYQVEGGWNADGKGENIWDQLTHNHPDLIKDHSTGDIACDSYTLWKTDIENLKTLGVDHYRFSLSWARILPDGFANRINQAGVDYYNRLIDTLLANGIEPMVTLYHWDLPQPLQDLGGWTNPQLAIYFRDYAEVAFRFFGDRVKSWITINEPASICVETYEEDNGAPHVKSPGVGLYLCGKTVLLAHAYAYRVYDSSFRHLQQGKIGITVDSIWAEPKSNHSDDYLASEREMQMGLGWWLHPIIRGDYPPLMKRRIGFLSKQEKFPQSRLPEFNGKEVKLIRGTWDFVGLNHYHTWLISGQERPIVAPPSYQKDKGTVGSQDPHWKPNPQIVPWGLRKLLNWIRMEYDNPLVIITENGYGYDEGGLDDRDRVLFLKEFLKAAVLAAVEDGCNVKGYTVWSLMDNMEWRSGYTVKFGLYDVNFSDANRTRTPKVSASFYQTVTRRRIIPEK